MGVTLASLSFIKLHTVPSSPDSDAPSPVRRAILAGLLDAGVSGVPVVSFWVRSQPWDLLQILVSGVLEPPAPGSKPEKPRPVVFPLGGTGTSVAAGDLDALFAPFEHWVACGGGFEPLLRQPGANVNETEQRWSASPFDDAVGYLSHHAFAWMVACSPVHEPSSKDELDALRQELFRLRQTNRLSETDVIDLERRQAWFRELSRAGHGGVWDVSIAVGTVDEAALMPVASVLCTAAEHSVPSYRLRPIVGATASSPEGALALSAPGELALAVSVPFRATSALAAALVRPPESELPGLRVVAPPSFDTTAEIDADDDWLKLGTVLDGFLRPAAPLKIGLGTLNRHTFVCGATGVGKSQTVRALLEALSRQTNAIPWLVIEPAKAEYARMAGRLSDVSDIDVVVIRPGDPHAPPASLNPLEPASLEAGNPARTFPLQSHADLVRALFLAAFTADEPFPQVVSKALIDCYAGAGWDLVTGEPRTRFDRVTGLPTTNEADASIPRYPTLESLQSQARAVVDKIGYGEDTKRDVYGFVDVRIGSLRLGTPGRFFQGGHPLDFGAVLKRNVVFEIETVTNDQDKAFLIGAILIRLYEQLLLEERERIDRDGPPTPFRHVTVIEEAHRLLRNVSTHSPAGHSLELFAGLLAEVRAYGEGIVVAEQIPSKLIPDVIKNTALKVVHRLPAADDREAVGATMNLSRAQSEYVVTLEPGTAAVFADGMDRPVLAQMVLGEEHENAKLAVNVAPLRGRRSRMCGQECQSGTPCSLLMIRHAERVLDDHPELTFWTELGVAAHTVGYGLPQIVGTRAIRQLRALAVTEPRLLQCTLAHGLERAITSRYEGLLAYFDPESLGVHLQVVMTGVLSNTGETGSCSRDRGRWRAGAQRFTDITTDLTRLAKGETPRLSQQEIARRAKERGVDFDDHMPDLQIQQLESLSSSSRLDEHGQRALLLGEVSPSRLMIAAAAVAGPGDVREQLKNASAKVLIWANDESRERLLDQLAWRPPAPGE